MKVKNIIFVLGIFIIGISCGSLFVKIALRNFTGDHATTEAIDWASKVLRADNGTIDATCSKIDTDGDGFISCTVSFDRDGQSKLLPVFCPSLFNFSESCKLSGVVSNP